MQNVGRRVAKRLTESTRFDESESVILPVGIFALKTDLLHRCDTNFRCETEVRADAGPTSFLMNSTKTVCNCMPNVNFEKFLNYCFYVFFTLFVNLCEANCEVLLRIFQFDLAQSCTRSMIRILKRTTARGHLI